MKPGAAEDCVCIYEQAFSQKALGETLRPGGLALTQRALECCVFPSGARMLDVGCGAGTTVQHLRDQGFSAYGADRSSALLQAGRQCIATLPVIRADAASLPLPAGEMDAVLAECSLSAFAQADTALKEFHRLLRSDGVLILTDLYVRNPSELPALQSLLPFSCLAQSFIQKDLLSHLTDIGFDLVRWEDHSEVIRSLSAQTTATLMMGACDHKIDPMDAWLTIARVKPGYFLCIAQKH
ncbi:MAG: DVU_1556 family methyltransferase [Anaerolineaceae bacterium]